MENRRKPFLPLMALFIVVVVITVIIANVGFHTPPVIQKEGRSLTFDDFSAINICTQNEDGTLMVDVVSQLGAPDGDAGFGMYIPYYKLQNGNTMVLSLYSTNEQELAVLSLTLVDQNGRKFRLIEE
ncbi:hypothetical protein LJC27_05005 [Christensenellaceae bacterium OttesenSCG-928-M15]|nr:hypothetical protein [Christensenellaceae bacterium OttesenSCG-928-M15]